MVRVMFDKGFFNFFIFVRDGEVEKFFVKYSFGYCILARKVKKVNKLESY